jgi:4-diphosphocytidyl-2-C-methyl-D-erythritol kinase
MRNDLEEAAIAQYPKLGDIIKSLEKAGCLKAMVTGSGSTVFGICMDCETAERVSTNLRSPEGEGFLIIAASNRL